MGTVSTDLAKAAASKEITNQPKSGGTVAKKLPGPAKGGKLGNTSNPLKGNKG